MLALSEFIREDYLKTSTLDPQRAYILHNCIDTSRFCPGPASKALRAQLGFTDADFIVLYCGRLDPDKGIHKLMEAIAALPIPQIKLLIVGSPFFARTQQSAFQRKLEQQSKSLGDRVQFTGYIPNEDLPDYYRLADLCCVPTLVEEAAGLVAGRQWPADGQSSPPAVGVCRSIWRAVRLSLWSAATPWPTSLRGASVCCMSTRPSVLRWVQQVLSVEKNFLSSITMPILCALCAT